MLGGYKIIGYRILRRGGERKRKLTETEVGSRGKKDGVWGKRARKGKRREDESEGKQMVKRKKGRMNGKTV